MKVRFLVDYVYDGYAFEKGEVREWPEHIARGFLRLGVAEAPGLFQPEEVEPKKVAKKPAKKAKKKK